MKARSSLEIYSLETGDQGHYRCISGNGIENDLIKQVDLLIKGIGKV